MIKPLTMLKIIEHSEEKFLPALRRNVLESDITIAIAVDFRCADEMAVNEMCEQELKPYFPLEFGKTFTREYLQPLINCINMLYVNKDSSEGGVILNITGNNLFFLNKAEQGRVNDYVRSLLDELKKKNVLKFPIACVLSNGQEGVGEAAAKAAYHAGINSTVLVPRNWLFTEAGRSMQSDKKAYLKRFEGYVNYVYPYQTNIRFEASAPLTENIFAKKLRESEEDKGIHHKPYIGYPFQPDDMPIESYGPGNDEPLYSEDKGQQIEFYGFDKDSTEALYVPKFDSGEQKSEAFKRYLKTLPAPELDRIKKNPHLIPEYFKKFTRPRPTTRRFAPELAASYATTRGVGNYKPEDFYKKTAALMVDPYPGMKIHVLGAYEVSPIVKLTVKCVWLIRLIAKKVQ